MVFQYDDEDDRPQKGNVMYWFVFQNVIEDNEN